MPSNSEYAQKQFYAEKACVAEKERLEHELRSMRKKIQALEEKVSSLSTELSRRKVIGEDRRGFS